VLLLTGDAGRGWSLLGVAGCLLTASQQLLPALHRELALATIAAAIATTVGCCLVLAALWHPSMTPVVAGGCVLALLLAFASAWQLDREIVPVAELTLLTRVTIVVACLIAGTAALLGVQQTRIDVHDARSLLAEPAVANTLIRDRTLADAYGDVERISIRWHGDTPQLTSNTGFFDGERGALARRRVEAVLHEAAREPGNRPVLREIVLTKSWYGVAAHHAINEIRGAGAQWPASARAWIAEESGSNDWRSAYYGESQRIVISRRESINLLRFLREPPGDDLDDLEAYSFHVLRHEIEHGMSSSGGEPQWITEAAAEELTQWAGRDEEVMDAAGFTTDYRGEMYGGDYERWGRLLYTVLEACRMSPDVPAKFDDAARLLRDRGQLAQVQLADCIARERGVERDGLVALIRDAGSSERARDQLLARLDQVM
jgi:hypothetical protein